MQRCRFIRRLGSLLAGLPALGLARPAGAGSSARMLFQMSPVAGSQHHAGERLRPILAEEQALRLVRQPQNPYDRRAVAVQVGVESIGYLPQHESAAIAQMLDRARVLEGVVVQLRSVRDPWERVRVAVYARTLAVVS